MYKIGQQVMVIKDTREYSHVYDRGVIERFVTGITDENGNPLYLVRFADESKASYWEEELTSINQV